MNTKLKKIVTVLIAFIILTTSVPLAEYVNAATTTQEIENDRAKIQKVKDELANAKSKRQQAENDLNNINLESASIMETKTKLDEQMADLITEIDLTEDLITEYETEIENINLQIASDQQKLDGLVESFNDRLRFSYEEGNTSYLSMIFSSGSFADFLSNIDYIGSMLDHDRNVMEQIEVTGNSLKVKEQELQDTLVEKSDYIVLLEKNKSEVEVLQAKTDNYLLKLSEDADKALAYKKALEKSESSFESEISSMEAEVKEKIAAEEARLAKLEDERKAKEEAEREAEKEAADNAEKTEAVQAVEGYFMWPVSLRKIKCLTDLYGYRYYNGRRSFHAAVDIAVATGVDVYAPASGVVVAASYSGSLGYYVKILHNNGMSTLMAHNSKLLVSAGDRVVQGQVVSKAGSTGDSTGPHVHFVMYTAGGSTVDPLKYFTSIAKKYT